MELQQFFWKTVPNNHFAISKALIFIFGTKLCLCYLLYYFSWGWEMRLKDNKNLMLSVVSFLIFMFWILVKTFCHLDGICVFGVHTLQFIRDIYALLGNRWRSHPYLQADFPADPKNSAEATVLENTIISSHFCFPRNQSHYSWFSKSPVNLLAP